MRNSVARRELAVLACKRQSEMEDNLFYGKTFHS